MNLGTLSTQAAEFAGDPDQTRYSGKYTTAANRAQEQFAMDTRALWKDTTWTSAANDASYDLPSDFMWEEWVKFDGKRLTPITRTRLDEIKGKDDWTADTGTPTHFIIDPEEATKQLLLYPIPTDADASKTISMRYFPLPTALSSSTDTPLNSSALMAQFHIGIAAYMAWLLLMTENLTPEIDAKMGKCLKLYGDAVTKAIDTFKNTASAPLRFRGTRAWR